MISHLSPSSMLRGNLLRLALRFFGQHYSAQEYFRVRHVHSDPGLRPVRVLVNCIQDCALELSRRRMTFRVNMRRLLSLLWLVLRLLGGKWLANCANHEK